MARVGRPTNNPEHVAAFAHNLNVIRTQHGMTNKQIADALGIKCVSQVSYWTAGKGMPNAKNLKGLAELFDVNVADLTGQTLMSVMKQQGVV